ncbi:MAG: hypothetical protein IPM79_20600 [Polyangiaceae bacterium]|jgi:hypothetical protein|nr:hypothetical protein [Polyangiaceae bacterium]MBK8939954.1 hypothetical protein [Polyangiaceae bacterium]
MMVSPDPPRPAPLRSRARGALWGLGVALLGCTAAGPATEPSASVAATARVGSAPKASASASVAVSEAVAAPPVKPGVAVARAREVLFPEGVPESAKCGAETEPGHVRCLIRARFAGHEAEQRAAVALYDEVGDVLGLEVEHDMNGGFRGTIHIVPELPVGKHKKHLDWVVGGQREIAAFVAALEGKAGGPVHFRHAGLAWRFMRSVGRTTPSAYAASWEVGYNVSGSLHASAEAVRDTVLHEVFHLNDQQHDNWSRRVLGPIVDGIAARCGAKTACLTPYAPMKTQVKGGTYYSFQPNNGDIAHEYSAELATRYFREQLAARSGKPYPGGWFKCGPKENSAAMAALAKEFFGGVDLTPSCP